MDFFKLLLCFLVICMVYITCLVMAIMSATEVKVAGISFRMSVASNAWLLGDAM